MALVGDTRVDHATGAARRRRERRFRAYLKYARMSVAMALAEANHHTAPRGQKTARAGATNETSKERVAGHAVYFELFDEDTSGWRPGPVLDPRPQERVLQHTVEHEDAIFLFVQILDVLMPQLGEQLVHFFRSLDTQLPVEQAIDVPKISDDSIKPRLVDRDLRFPQMVEQLVEVPTILSFASLQQQIVERTVNIPVPRGRGAQVVEVVEVFTVSLQGQNPAAFVEQSVDIPVPGGAVHDLHPDPGLAASSAVSRDEAFQGVLRNFPRFQKKCAVLREAECEGARALELIHAVCSSWWCRAS